MAEENKNEDGNEGSDMMIPPKPPARGNRVGATTTPELKQQTREAAANRKYYEGFPKIWECRVCEFCGTDYRGCPHYKKYYDKIGDFTCLCQAASDDTRKGSLRLLYVPHHKVIICGSEGCRKIYEDRFGGYEPLVSFHFFMNEVPYGNRVSLPDPSDNRPNL